MSETKAPARLELASRECKPCQTKGSPLNGEALTAWREKLGKGWSIINDHHLEKQYTFEDFQGALDFTKRVGEMAEQQGHHPDIYLSWGKVRLKIWTHNIDGLAENDFIIAAKADELFTA